MQRRWGFPLAGLRDGVGRLAGEVRRLHSDNVALRAGVDARQAVAALRAGHTDCAVNAAALERMRGHSLSGQVIGLLDAHPAQHFADTSAWSAHLARLGIDQLPATPEQRQAVELVRILVWWLYAGLKAWARDPCPRRAAALRARLDRLLRRRASSVTLDRPLDWPHRRKPELLRALEPPETPLHANGSENDIRACVTKRKASGGTTSTAGRTARRRARPHEDLQPSSRSCSPAPSAAARRLQAPAPSRRFPAASLRPQP